ncbi:EamA family transporter [Flavobacterium cyanobacteriorum]|uniref:EamA family transporter n=1 Tax=Flavobacterium cyanobacteriorum TaxID=2022802 RepID=A0A255Z890_9FLAO|nr:DMT family transporter [Flavobacterium cyanobacteriorum]OYQ37659.1 EamA family transporter [Flavobacterium cyanobacteriorum]
MPSDNVRSYIHLHFIVFVWGFTAVLGALITLDALPLVWFRMSIAVAIILLFIFLKKIPLTLPRKTLVSLLAAGLVIALHWLTFFKAIKVSNISVTLACMSTGAFFTSLLEPFFFGRKIIWYEVVFGLLVIAGLYIIFSFEGDYLYGILLALASAFLSASFAIINGKLAKSYNPSVISFYELLGGVFFFSVYLLFTGSFTPAFFNVSADDWLWLFALGSFCTAYAFIASVQVMKFLSPYTVMLTINLEPIYGIILALIVFDDKEKMSAAFYTGAAVILCTVIINGIVKDYTKNKS